MTCARTPPLFAPLLGLGLGLVFACSKPAPTGDDEPPKAPAEAAAVDGGATTAKVEGSAAAADDDGDLVFGDLRVTPLRHASTLLRHGGRTIYVDPWSKAALDGLPKADIILITDIHGDHLDKEAIAGLRQASTVLIGPQAVADALREAGAEWPVEIVANGETRTIAGLEVEAVAMYNRKRGPAEGEVFHEEGRGNGYILRFGDQRVYFSGDTECTAQMRALENIDVAFVCMNLPYTMPPSEAIDCIRAFAPKVIVPYHYRGSDVQEVVRAFAETPAIEVRTAEWYPGGEG
jgi:L-ascorbate metabolism protein UlaG (beta-lactamase superfamily)